MKPKNKLKVLTITILLLIIITNLVQADTIPPPGTKRISVCSYISNTQEFPEHTIIEISFFVGVPMSFEILNTSKCFYESRKIHVNTVAVTKNDYLIELESILTANRNEYFENRNFETIPTPTLNMNENITILSQKIPSSYYSNRWDIKKSTKIEYVLIQNPDDTFDLKQEKTTTKYDSVPIIVILGIPLISLISLIYIIKTNKKKEDNK